MPTLATHTDKCSASFTSELMTNYEENLVGLLITFLSVKKDLLSNLFTRWT